jgi:hypothetical protein
VRRSQRGPVELARDLRTGTRFGERRIERHGSGRPVLLLVDGGRTGEGCGVGGRGQRAPFRERPPEIEADAAQREQQQADPEEPQGDRARLLPHVHGAVA